MCLTLPSAMACMIPWMSEVCQPRLELYEKWPMFSLSIEDLIPHPVGQNWVRNFANRHEELKKFSRKYDYQRALCEDPEVTRGWFKLVQNTIAKYGILPDDIYNFDETGFQMGVIATTRVVTGSEKARNPKLVQPGDRE
ncbi:hypothetical protein VTO42DRAFT_1045 [Malbranchea cinnamomea]